MSIRRNLLTATIAAALTVGFTAPTAASGNLLDDLVGGVNDTVNDVRDTVNGVTGQGGGGGSPAPAPSGGPTPQAGTPPSYTPPLHGSNPHGQGTGAVVDLTPDDAEPLPYEEGGGSEDVVVGRARGEQDGDEYHGHITILTLLGMELVPGADTNEGETDNGPLGPLNDLLDDVCAGSGDTLCLNVLDMESTTDENGSTNTFSVADVNVGTGGFGISATAVNSEGTISDDGTCQTSTGSSSVANANVLDAVTADLLDAESESQACNDGTTSTQSNEGSGINILGAGVPIPATGCEDGTANTVFDPPVINVLLQSVCNADDSNGSQADEPYGVREALSAFILPVLGPNALVKATTAAGESHAVAPEGAGPACPDPANPDCPQPPDCPDPSDPSCPGPDDPGDGPDGPGDGPDGPGDGPGGPAGPGDGPSADDAPDNLPFTGADMLPLALIGGFVVASGLAMMGLADRRRRARA